MNASEAIQDTSRMGPTGPRELLDIARDHWGATVALIGGALLAGAAYLAFARPVYEANLIIQVEEPASPVKSFIGDAASGFEIKTQASAEMELLRSRMVLAPAVDNARLFIDAQPRYVPVVGHWLARHAGDLSTPGILGLGGWVSGTERIDVRRLDVPAGLEESRITLRAEGDGRYSLHHPKFAQPLEGKVGAPLSASLEGGTLALDVGALDGRPGAEFSLVRRSYAETLAQLQRDLKLVERGKLSGVIEVALRDTDPVRLSAILNDIGATYLQKNVQRKSSEADKALNFLQEQLPGLQRQAERAENAYNQYRLSRNIVSLNDQSKQLVDRSADIRASLQAAQQKRSELETTLASNHPAMLALNEQIAGLERQVKAFADQTRAMPTIQQDAARLERDMTLSNQMYQQLRNSVLQLQLLREGKSGNVRLVDAALPPTQPVQPKPALVMGIALFAGLVLAVLTAIVRSATRTRIRTAYEIESRTGLNIFGAIPRIKRPDALALEWAGHGADATKPASPRLPGFGRARTEPAALALKNLATTLQFGLSDSGHRRILISGATRGVGRTFITVNLARLLAGAGLRVLLIDADFKGGHMDTELDVNRAPGLAELLAGTVPPEEVTRFIQEPRMVLVPAGQIPAGVSAQKLMSKLPAMVDRLAADFDLILIGGPPVLESAETLFLASACDSVLLVARSEHSRAEEVAESARRLAQWGYAVSGVIVNDIDPRTRHLGSFGHVYGNLAYRPAN